MQEATYAPDVFDVATMRDARQIILTDEKDRPSALRWEQETPHLVSLMERLELTPESLVLDYGCGAGRLSKALIDRFGCRVVGVDTSSNMRVFAANYVRSERFMACHPLMLGAFGLQFDAALSVWVIQHCLEPEKDLDDIKSALKPGGRYFIVNERGRAVPVRIGAMPTWADDGRNTEQLLAERFTSISRGKLNPKVVGEEQSERTFWACYLRS